MESCLHCDLTLNVLLSLFQNFFLFYSLFMNIHVCQARSCISFFSSILPALVFFLFSDCRNCQGGLAGIILPSLNCVTQRPPFIMPRACSVLNAGSLWGIVNDLCSKWRWTVAVIVIATAQLYGIGELSFEQLGLAEWVLTSLAEEFRTAKSSNLKGKRDKKG